MSDQLLTAHEAAKLLTVKPKTLDRWRWLGGGPKFYKVGRLVRYKRSDLEAFLAAGERTSTSDPGPEETYGMHHLASAGD